VRTEWGGWLPDGTEYRVAALERHATATLTAAERANLRSALAKIIAQLQNEPS
jgi:hypothetical protein